MLFRLDTWLLVLLLVLVVVGATVAGLVLGRWLRGRSEGFKEPMGVLQGAVLGIVGLLLAFSMSLAVGRYEDRRAALVAEANAIGTTWLRAQTLQEPQRSRSLALLVDYTDLAIRSTHERIDSDGLRRTTAAEGVLQRRLWRLAGQSLAGAPVASAPRLYVETLNDMIDQQTVRISSLSNRVPESVLWLDVIASAVALGLLAMYIAFVGRGHVTVVLAALLVAGLLFVIFDLDRPTRGVITVPDTPLTSLRASMALPPAAEGPG